MRRLLLLALAAALVPACFHRDDDDDDDPAPIAPATGSVDDPTVPRDAEPPLGVTWYIGVTDNVPLSELEDLVAAFATTNVSVWDVTEGQVRIHRVVISDNVMPGTDASEYVADPGAFNDSSLDIIVWPAARWDLSAGGAVGWGPGIGRTGRIMLLPQDATDYARLHEAGHFLFNLTWGPGPLLIDEYEDGIQDAACLMESANLPVRWCSAANHEGQTSQPQSCWAQILADYPIFAYAGTDTAGSLPAAVEVEYNDTP